MAIRQQKRCFYEFGPYRLDPLGRVLRRGAEAVPLTPKLFDILLMLVEHHGQVVEKEMILQEIWPDTAVEEGNLTTNISTLRKMLGEGAGGQPYIQTVPRRGYRFVGEVTEVIAATARPAAKDPLELHLVGRQGRNALTRGLWVRMGTRGGMALMACALLVVSAVLAFVWVSKRAPAAGGVKTIAVLPFKPLVTDGRDEGLEMGMAETLIQRLSGLRQLDVRPLNAVRKYTALDQDAVAAGRELGVDYVLEGNLQLVGEKTRATVALWDVREGRAVWKETCDEQCSTILALQDAIAARITTALAVELTGEEKKRLARHDTESPEAHREYLSGRYLHQKRTGPMTKKSIEHFERAVKLDPDYALAYAALADAHLSVAKLGGRLPVEEVMPRAKAAAGRALQIDATLAEAHAAMGSIRFYEWDWPGAESEFKRAIELNPDYERNNSDYEHCLLAMKRFDEAVAESKRVLELEPLSAHYNRNLGMVLYFARRYDEAVEQLQKTIDFDPQMVTIYAWLAAAYEQKRLYDRSVEASLSGREVSGAGPEEVRALREAYAASGWKGFWRKALELAAGQARQENVNAVWMAEVCARLEEKDQAFSWLEKAYEQRLTRMKFLNTDPAWDGLRPDPRYAGLVRRMGLEP